MGKNHRDIYMRPADARLWNRLTEIAAELETSVSAIIAGLIDGYVEEHDGEQPL